ncbi:uncharacterized protein LOC111243724 [Varroa destructor]|uniref:Uncharacterized protein n=1 Tax=Varroa destructor TaxID=109461 RepID=A0A7M7J338_VARDE|nr:uncharacterized protein LOC111243724 [Varroa destructor]
MTSAAFFPDFARGYFCRQSTFPLGEQKGLDDGFLRLASVHFEPFIFQNRSTTHVTIAGPLVITLEAIMAALKLRNATIVSSRLEPYGVDMGNGTHSGILGRVQSGEAHLILNVAICDENRFTFVDPVILLISAYRLLTAKARKVIHPFNFLRAFQPDVWYILFPSINVAACCIFLLDRYIVKGRFGTSPATLSAYIWNFWRRFFPQDECSTFSSVSC